MMGVGAKRAIGLYRSCAPRQNLEKVLFTGPKTSDTVTFICD